MTRNMADSIKIAQFGLGPIGISTIKMLALKPWAKIVGGIDIDPDKVGRKVSEVCDIPELNGVNVYDTFEELWKHEQPDAVIHTAGSKAETTFNQVRPMCERGLTVVSSCEELLYPYLRAPESSREIDELCRKTGARLLGTGVNPGYVHDLLPVCLTGVCLEANGIYGERVVDASTRRQPLQKKIGSGMEPDHFRALWSENKIGHAGFQESVMLIAHALNWEMGPISEKCDPVIADHDIKSDFFEVPTGMTCGLHQSVHAETDSGKVISLVLKMYLDAPDPHDAIRIDTEPPIRMLLEGGIAGDYATVAALINAIPRLQKATPGLKLMTELPVPAMS